MCRKGTFPFWAVFGSSGYRPFFYFQNGMNKLKKTLVKPPNGRYNALNKGRRTTYERGRKMTRKKYIGKMRYLALLLNKEIGGKPGSSLKGVKERAKSAVREFGSYEACYAKMVDICKPLLTERGYEI